ncbi:MAG: sxtJ [Deltaproteobacteria bacterium]|nr:sxtJ [Deltaproteobacteria bacterium]
MSPTKPFFQYVAPDRRELRRFGLLVGGVFAGLFGLVLPFLLHRPYPRWPWFPAVPLLFFALLFPPALKIPHRAWTLLGEVLNWVNTRIVLSLLFFLIFTPISLVLKMLGKDPMFRRFQKEMPSYRSPSREPLPGQMERPF